MKLSRKIHSHLIYLRFGQILLTVGILLILSGFFIVPFIHSDIERHYKEFFIASGVISVSISIVLNISGIIKLRKEKT